MIKERLAKLLENKSIPKEEFYKNIGMTSANFRGAAKKTPLNSNAIENILSLIPDVNLQWLLTGEGPMFKPVGLINSASNSINTQVTEEPQTQNRASKSNKPIVDIETRPRIPLNAIAGTLSFALEGGTANDCEQLPVIRAFPRYDFTILINGESMEPELRGGDELACLNVNNTSYIQGGRIYVLDTDQGIVVKRVSDNDECLLCHSDNQMFKDYNIPKQSVYNIALVVGMLRRY